MTNLCIIQSFTLTYNMFDPFFVPFYPFPKVSHHQHYRSINCASGDNNSRHPLLRLRFRRDPFDFKEMNDTQNGTLMKLQHKLNCGTESLSSYPGEMSIK